jgi:hypothetical protein
MKEDIKVGKYKVKKDNLIKLLLFVKEKENNKDKMIQFYIEQLRMMVQETLCRL